MRISWLPWLTWLSSRHARIEALQQQMDLHVHAHTQQMTEMRAQTQQTTLIHQQQIAFQQAQQDHHRAQELARGPRGPASIKRFRDLRPPTFAGTEQALEADEWLQRIIDALKAADVEDEKKVEIVALQLTDLAQTWWKAEAGRIEVTPIPWDTFTERFHAMYFPKAAKNRLMTRFIELKQGGRSVEEYEAEFTLLSNYRYNCHFLSILIPYSYYLDCLTSFSCRFSEDQVKDPVKRADKFIRGLDTHIQKLLIGTPPTTHEAALTAARGWELIAEEERAAQARAR